MHGPCEDCEAQLATHPHVQCCSAGNVQAEDDEGQKMTDEELWEDVHDIMGAGHETTATTSAAAVLLNLQPLLATSQLTLMDGSL